MKNFLLIVSLIFFSSGVSADQTTDDPSPKIRQLYVCHYFFDSGARSTNSALKAKASELSNQFLFRASVLAVGAGGEGSANKLASDARGEFASFLSDLRGIQSEAERTQRLEAFNTSCLNVLDARIEIKPADRSADLAEKLYSCSQFYSAMSQSGDQPERQQFASASDEFLVKAKSVANKLGNEAQTAEIFLRAEKKAGAFIAGLSEVSEQQKAARIKKYTKLCTISKGRASAE